MEKSDKRTRRGRVGKDKSERSKFATAIARAEFGRFYWSGEQAERLEEAMRAPRSGGPGKTGLKK